MTELKLTVTNSPLPAGEGRGEGEPTAKLTDIKVIVSDGIDPETMLVINPKELEILEIVHHKQGTKLWVRLPSPGGRGAGGEGEIRDKRSTG